ncbi:MAG: Mini-ribonuclease 3 [Clostridia bacterium]|nr:Mini-ribonuclease 3 [Clostridia bacterium]
METIFTKQNIKEISVLALSFIGDGVHTVFVRDYILKTQNLLIGSYHNKAIKFCSAQSQSKVFDRVYEILNDEEKEIAQRARNAKGHKAKNASLEDYKKATAFEAVVGYLYLLKQYDRLNEILNLSIKNVEGETL